MASSSRCCLVSLILLVLLLAVVERAANHTTAGRLLGIIEIQRQRLQPGATFAAVGDASMSGSKRRTGRGDGGRDGGGGSDGGDGCPQAEVGCATLYATDRSGAGLQLVHGCDDTARHAARKANGLGAPPALVYIAGRHHNGDADASFSKHGDGDGGLQEALVSIFSACQQASKPLHFHVFMSPADSNRTSGGRSCSLCRLAAACAAGLGQSSAGSNGTQSEGQQTAVAWFTVRPLSAEILWWFHDELGLVEFNHHSSWFGYTKLWLPRLLPDVEWALFIDTDTMFLRDPWELLDTRLAMTAEQDVSAAYLPGAGFTIRINSGVVLMSLTRLRARGWESALLSAISRNRGWPAGLPIAASAKVQVRGKGAAASHGPARTAQLDEYNVTNRPCNDLGAGDKRFGWHTDPGYQMCLVKPCTDDPRFCKKGVPRLRVLPPRACSGSTWGSRPLGPLPRTALWEAISGDQEFFSSALSYGEAQRVRSMNVGPDGTDRKIHHHAQGIDRYCQGRDVSSTVVLHSGTIGYQIRIGQDLLRKDPKTPGYQLLSPSFREPDTPEPKGQAPNVTMVRSHMRCGKNEWLGRQGSAAACAARVLAEPPAAKCSHALFVFADDGNCACAPSEAKCVDGASGVTPAAVSSLYSIAIAGGPTNRTIGALPPTSTHIDAGCEHPCGRPLLLATRHCPITREALHAFVAGMAGMKGAGVCGQCLFE